MEQSQSNLLSCFSSTAPWNAPAPAAPADVLKSLSSDKISTPITKRRRRSYCFRGIPICSAASRNAFVIG